ncbi:hypothetical protein LXA43DRAFT_160210 [Ganoderma leucocontextum]|nr:hypothetical protein LXA43DRAFT_160210 [Ganoderma leucocontextum]
MNFHAVSHSFPHRGPGASRARTRWQPYAPNVALSAISRSPSGYLHTPASSVSSISPQTIHLPPICDHERLKAPLQSSPLANPLRESQRAKYAAKLVGSRIRAIQIKRSKRSAIPGIPRTSPPSSPHVRVRPFAPSPNRPPRTPNALPPLL